MPWFDAHACEVDHALSTNLMKLETTISSCCIVCLPYYENDGLCIMDKSGCYVLQESRGQNPLLTSPLLGVFGEQ